jgi:hypothetical protein
MAARRVPAVVYSVRSTSIGVAEYSVSGLGPRESVFSRQAISSWSKFSLVIWSAGE